MPAKILARVLRRPSKAPAAVAGLAWLLCAAATPAPAFYTFGNGSGNKWGDPAFGKGAFVTWGYMADGTGVDPGFRIDPWNYPDISGLSGTSNISQLRSTIDAQYGEGAFDAAIRRALDTWEAAGDVIFIGPIPDSGLPINDPDAVWPEIRIGAFMPDPSHSFAGTPAVGFAPPYNGGTLAGDVIFNLSLPLQIAPGDEDVTEINYFFGNDLEGLFLHELGHAAMGLGHPDPNDAATDVGSVMYVGFDCCAYVNRQLADDDIQGAQYVYGPAVAVKVGDFDRDDEVSVLDVVAVVTRFGTALGDPDYDPAADWTRDGAIDVIDIVMTVTQFGQ